MKDKLINMNKKNILSIIFILLIGVLAGVSIFVASRLSQQQAVAPTAPTRSQASEACGQKYYLVMGTGQCVSTSSPDGYDANQVECNANAANCSDNVSFYLDGQQKISTGGVCFNSKAECEATATDGARPGTGDNTFTCTAADAATHPACGVGSGNWQDGTCIWMICPQGDTNGDGSCGVQDTGYRVKGAGNCWTDVIPKIRRLPKTMCYQFDSVKSAADNTYCPVSSPCVSFEANMGNCGANVTPVCTDTSWSPDPSTVCSDTSVAQTSNCGNTRSVAGTKDCYVASQTTCTTTLCVASEVKTCTPDCPTDCGKVASTISTCTDSCGTATTKACPATAACGEDITIEKKAYKNEAINTAGNYTLTTEIDKVSRNQVFVYTLLVKNTGPVTVTNAVVTDALNGEHQDILAFMDSKNDCSYTASSKTVTCAGLSLAPNEEGKYSFRVRVGNGAVNGNIIKNTGKVTLGNVIKEARKDLTVSTVVGCNNTCTNDSECSSGLVCDTAVKMCRKEACLIETGCVCPIITAAPTVAHTVAPTVAPTTQPTAEPTILVEAPTLAPTAAPTEVAIVEPTILPETGILDFPGVAAFGGGLLLAIIGILLAL